MRRPRLKGWKPKTRKGTSRVKIAIAVAFAAAASQATAQPVQCTGRPVLLDRLTTVYGEVRQSAGIGNGNFFETFANDETGTWTTTITYPNGRMCILSSGSAFEGYDEELPVGDPA